MNDAPLRLAAVLFEGFETLDVFGPLQIFGNAPDVFEIFTVAPASGPVRSRQGQQVVAEYELHGCPEPDALLVPGGWGTRELVDDPRFIEWLAARGRDASLTMSVCTGAALIARAGLLDGRRATTNKLAFDWVRSQGPKVEWQTHARWIDEGEVVTSAGVSAGIDMALGVIARLVGEDRARLLADLAEYEWNRNPDHDRFATAAGLA